MALYQYVKAAPQRVVAQTALPLKVLPFLFMGAGGAMLVWVIWPILSFTISWDQFYQKTITPLAEASHRVTKPQALPAVPVVLAAGVTSRTDGGDYTNVASWFPSKPQRKVVTPVNSYVLSIPKLKIEKATVQIAGDDLNKSLVHYGGTGLPGQYGNAVIFGHSVLPQFYDPKNYRSIFSTLPTLKVGDEMEVEYDGVRYTYEVYEMVVTDPNDLSPLEQHFDDSYLTLITCVPPGTYWKRLNVRTRLKHL